MKKLLLILGSMLLLFSCSNEEIVESQKEMKVPGDFVITDSLVFPPQNLPQLPGKSFILPSLHTKNPPYDIPWINGLDDIVQYCEDNYTAQTKEDNWAGIHVNATIPPVVMVVRYVMWNNEILLPRLQIYHNRNIPKGSVLGGMYYKIDSNSGSVNTVGTNRVTFNVLGKISSYLPGADPKELQWNSFSLTGDVPVSLKENYGGSSVPLRPEVTPEVNLGMTSVNVNMGSNLSHTVIIPDGYVPNGVNSVQINMYTMASVSDNKVTYKFDPVAWRSFGKPINSKSVIKVKKGNFNGNYTVNFTFTE